MRSLLSLRAVHCSRLGWPLLVLVLAVCQAPPPPPLLTLEPKVEAAVMDETPESEVLQPGGEPLAARRVKT